MILKLTGADNCGTLTVVDGRILGLICTIFVRLNGDRWPEAVLMRMPNVKLVGDTKERAKLSLKVILIGEVCRIAANAIDDALLSTVPIVAINS